MTITLPLQPQEEAKLIAIARAKGLSTDALVREALEKILADAPDEVHAGPPSPPVSGAALVAAMQASPYRETDIEPVRSRLPVRDLEF
jgi:hypothetical protein